MEYYKTFAHILVKPLMAACNKVPERGELPPSWRQANIIVLPKPDRDPLQARSYRPICLLNVDQFFFTSFLARRLNLFVDQYILQVQVGFISSRDIWDNTTKVLQVLATG